jgi:hypothetical protein
METKIVEHLLDDIHTDFRYSTDLRKWLEIICDILAVPYHMPRERIPHRWLSVFDCLEIVMPMLPALKVLYFSWVPGEDMKSAYKEEIDKIISKCSDPNKQEILKIQKLCQVKYKNMTPQGKDRKKRVADKILYQADITSMYISLYQSVLPLFKSFVLIFEQHRPMVHKLHDKLVDTTRCFLACFLKPEVLNVKSAKALQKIDVKDQSKHLPPKEMFVGEDASLILTKLDQKAARFSNTVGMVVPGFHIQQEAHPADDFRKEVQSAFIESGEYLLKKFPLQNPLLMKLSATDPIAQGHGETGKTLKKLVDFFPTVVDDKEKQQYKEEVVRLQIDQKLPKCEDDAGNEVSLDVWWSKVFGSKGNYPILSKVIKACLSIITSPVVERNFSVMNNVVTPKTNRFDMVTVNAILSVKGFLKAKKTTSLKLYHRDNVKFCPVDKAVVYHMQTAYGRYKKRMAEKRKPKKTRMNQTSIHVRAKELKKKMLQKRKIVNPEQENVRPKKKHRK